VNIPIAIAIAVVRHADRVLIGQRPPGVALAGMWEFPGGKLQPGETSPDAAARECLEETGIVVNVVDELAQVVHDYPHGRVALAFHSCRPVDLTAVPRPPFRWVPLSDLPQYEFPPANAQVLRHLTVNCYTSNRAATARPGQASVANSSG
jgi:8-oxo-dGTP diphosphatase